MITFIYEDSRWVAENEGIIYYLNTGNPITLTQDYQNKKKPKSFECEDIYEAINKIFEFTNHVPRFKSSNELGTTTNYML